MNVRQLFDKGRVVVRGMTDWHGARGIAKGRRNGRDLVLCARESLPGARALKNC